uniref:Rieske domain-containing protein n=1 Tax=Trieres chinensis TaxID=1514140 RepID=A0A7S2ET22_TRICV|mmetsp:Transcript_35805/g.73209  ORF Transcript_35805/g.73209 Transcript_35805/m.73209 type:complete len:580 (+) Transcript_35805:97-1836(+)
MKLPLLIPLALIRSGASLLTPLQSSRQKPGSRSIVLTSSSGAMDQATASEINGSAERTQVDDEEESGVSEIRPIHQNWWPVSTTFALDKSRPNPVDLLNQKLVVFWSESENEWKCLDDRCSHRFAPLSEGRVIDNNCLQCAYHGWEFNGEGKCTKVPQAARGAVGRSVTGYPVRVEASMVFVWADPDSFDTLGKSTTIPIFPKLKEAVEVQGESFCFMRDLPYGYELLGENLLDLSHLPFSHHGVGNLDRELGCPLPFRVLPASEKSKDNPLYEVILEDAANTDPTYKGFPVPVPPDASLNLGFYDPCHVRYTRQRVPGDENTASVVALYMCPTLMNKSRVFLFNIFPKRPPPPKKTKLQRLKSWVTPSEIKQKLAMYALARLFTPVFGHLMSHKIFDGDGIFLHKQGDRMARSGLSYKDYDTPSSADVMVNKFRRYSNAASQNARLLGLEQLAESVSPSSGYNDNLPRSEMLDRYESHTKHCKICLEALEKAQLKKKRLELVQTALIGAAGASSVTLAGGLGLSLLRTLRVPSILLKGAAGVTLSCVGGCKLTSKLKAKVEKEIQQFLFEDYIHADKH